MHLGDIETGGGHRNGKGLDSECLYKGALRSAGGKPGLTQAREVIAAWAAGRASSAHPAFSLVSPRPPIPRPQGAACFSDGAHDSALCNRPCAVLLFGGRGLDFLARSGAKSAGRSLAVAPPVSSRQPTPGVVADSMSVDTLGFRSDFSV